MEIRLKRGAVGFQNSAVQSHLFKSGRAFAGVPIDRAIDVVVQIDRTAGVRRVSDIRFQPRQQDGGAGRRD